MHVPTVSGVRARSAGSDRPPDERADQSLRYVPPRTQRQSVVAPDRIRQESSGGCVRV